MKKLLLLCACLLALLLSPCSLVAAPPSIVVVRIDEYGSTVMVSVTRGEGKSELLKFDRKGPEQLVKTSENYYKIFQQLYQEGYKLQSTFTTSQGYYSTLLFVKEQ